MQSFVSKVHRHTVARVAPDDGAALPACEDPTSFLLPLVSMDAPDATLHATLESILASYRLSKVSFRKHGGLMKIMPLIARPSLSPETSSVLIEFLLGEASVPCMFAHAVLNVPDSLQCVQTLLTLFFSSGTDVLESSLVLISSLLEDVDTCELLHRVQPSAITYLLPKMTSRVYEDVRLCEKSLKCMSQLVHDDTTASMFWRVGHFLVEAIAKATVSKPSSSSALPLVVAISHLNLVAPRPTERALSLSPSTNMKVLCQALTLEMETVSTFRLFELVMRSATLRHQLPRQTRCFRMALARYLGTFMHELNHDLVGYTDVLHTLQHVIELATPVVDTEAVASEMLVLYSTVCTSDVTDAPSQKLRIRALAAHATCLLGSPNLIGFVKLLGALQAIPSDWPESDALDEALRNYFVRVLSPTPCRMVHPFAVHGRPPRLLLHLAREMLGDAVASPRREARKRYTSTERAIVTAVQAQVEEAIKENGADARHAQEVAVHFGMTYDPVPDEADADAETCPITLMPMHCPVILSDGHTYELSAIVRGASQTFQSPITREDLEPWLVYNRACLARVQTNVADSKDSKEMKPEPPSTTMRRTLNGRRSMTSRMRSRAES